MNIVAAEWVRLRQPRILAGVMSALALFAILSTLMTLTLLLRNGTVRGFENVLLQSKDFIGSGGLALLIERQVMIIGLAVSSVSASQFATDYMYGTIRMISIREPNRLRWLMGKLCALIIFHLLAVVTAVLCTGFTAWFMQNNLLTFNAWWSLEGWTATSLSFLNLSLAAIGYGVIGAIGGLILKSSLEAVSLLAGYMLFEGVLAGLFGSVFQCFPGQTLAAIAQGGNSLLSYRDALIWSSVYLTLILIYALRQIVTRDITE